MIDVKSIVDLQTAMVIRWHQQAIDNPALGQSLHETICQQHQFNFLLWHEEDIARSPAVSDSEIARVKRSIDRYNQQRNDWIEKIDDEITGLLVSASVVLKTGAGMNTETPGATIDRLSILALRIFHLQEQLERVDVDESHLQSVRQKIAICQLQQDELTTALQQLVEGIFAGQKRHRTYRQLKMYNDPSLNPYLYRNEASRV